MSNKSGYESEARWYEPESEASDAYGIGDVAGERTPEDCNMNKILSLPPAPIQSASLSPSHSPTPEDRMLVDDGMETGSPNLQQDSAPHLDTRHDSGHLLDLFEDVVAQLKQEGLTFADWLILIFEPKWKGTAQDLRLESFWQHDDLVRNLLDSWVHTHQTQIGRETVSDWAMGYVALRMRSESRKITSEGVLRSSNEKIGPSFLKGFKIDNIKQAIQAHCPTSVKMLLSMAGANGSKTLMEAPISAQN
ncbi:hypothetical protein FRC07_014688, partial [Ceratobasidium sp. 392]